MSEIERHVGRTSGLPVPGASGSVDNPFVSFHGAGGSGNRQTGGLPHKGKGKRSLSTKLALVISLVITVINLGGTYIAYQMAKKPANKQSTAGLVAQTDLIKEMVAQFDNSGRYMASQMMGVLTSMFPEGIVAEGGQSLKIGSQDTPVLKSGGAVLNLNFTQVDRFTQITRGSVATIFAKRGSDFIRITTSLKKEDGSRAIGTLLDQAHPAYGALLDGASYVGKARLFGRDFMTHYTPIKNASGEIIGVFFIGSDITEPLNSLANAIKKLKFGESGYVYVLDSQGNMIIHPAKEGRNLLATRNDDGREIFKEMVAMKEGVLNYTWANHELGETKSRDKMAVLSYYKNWDWIIVASGYNSELYRVVNYFKNILTVISILSALVTSILAYLMIRRSFKPLAAIADNLERIGQGDVASNVADALRDRNDEIGDIGRSTQRMTENLRNLLYEVSRGVQTLASSATELTSISSQTATGVKSVSDITSTVAAAAEEASSNTSSVATGMEQAATNLSSVASATEEMSATIGEIAANSEKARAISEQATAQTHIVSTLMRQLGQAASDIGKVTETITDISAQTNLLALNATIEAARAGAAGKGFAVVANEIKELARQTATATEGIKAKIAGVQTSAGSAITDIEKISGVIKEVGSIVSSIAAAIEEQATVTKDVAGNIAQAAAGVKESNERVAQTSTVSKSIAREIAEISAAAGELRQDGEQVKASAAELSKLAEQLQATVGHFKLETHVGQTSGLPVPGASGSVDNTSVIGAGLKPVGILGAGGSGNRQTGGLPHDGDLIQWEADYSVGVLTMDAHHQKLISLINQLSAALKRGDGKAATQAILKQLIAYTQYHFQAEEEMMAKVNYSGLAAQKKAHTDFLSVVAAARDRWEAGDNTVPKQLLTTLKQWLIHHITGMDKQYSKCFGHGN